MAGDRVEQLREDSRIEIARALLDHAQSEMDMAEQTPLLRLAERGAAAELPHAADVVEKCGCEQEVGAETRVELRGLAAERRHPDGVLEETARVAVVPIRACGGQRAERGSKLGIRQERAHHLPEAGVGDLRGEELEEAVQLVGIASQRGCELRGVRVLRRLDSAHLHLQLPSESLHAAQHLDGVAFGKAAVEELDVAPDAGVDPPTRVGELECEVGGARAGAAALLLRDREHPLDGPILDELGDGHAASLGRRGVGTLARMADVQPFRAVRYTDAAGPLADLVAPPYDAVSDEERARLYTRSPYNVVHMTLPESAGDARRLYDDWLDDGILALDDGSATWLVAEEYVGPDGIAGERHGVVLSVAADTYEADHVLPHERTHASIRAERLQLLRATLVQPEPILLLADTSLELSAPAEPPDVEVGATKLWRAADIDLDALGEAQLLIADGHHRYESAAEFGAERGATGARIMALVVPAHDVGLHVFPTHRVFSGRPDLAGRREGEAYTVLDDALSALEAEPFSHSAAVAYRRGSIELVRGRRGELDVELVDHHGLAGITYTPRAREAVAAVDSGGADVAFILREPRVDDLFALARRGERMPPKSTYFHPKPLSGLLFHPVAT